jgi:hypothetical protein
MSGFGKVPPCSADCPGCRDFLGSKGGKSAYDVGDGSDVVGDTFAEPLAPEMQEFGLLASSAGATPGGLSAAPGMIGDFFSTGYGMRFSSAGQLASSGGTGPHNEVVVPNGTTLPLAGGDRRFKVADNTSPFPTDRYFFTYHHFHGALLDARGTPRNLDRMLFGLEKTFRGGLCSLEVRVPFSSGLSSDQSVLPGSDNTATEFGNIGLALKRLIYQGERMKASLGLGMVLPTAEDTSLRDSLRNKVVVEFSNDAYYLQPFFGLLYEPNNCWFFQTFVQMDFDTNGNEVRFANDPSNDGVIQDQTLLYMDYSAGYWVFHNPCGGRIVSGLAPMVELHYTTTVNSPDSVSRFGGADETTNFAGRQDVLNITGGLRFEIWGSNYLTVAGVAPLRDGLDKIFDAEFSLQYVGLY